MQKPASEIMEIKYVFLKVHFHTLDKCPHYWAFHSSFCMKQTVCMLDFFRSNCSWYISGITKGNDRSQSIPSRAYDLWPARPFVIVVVDHTIPHKHISIRWIIVSSILMSSSSAASFFRSFSSEWKSWSSKQCSYLMNQKKDKSLKVGSSHLLVILDIYGKLHWHLGRYVRKDS